MRNWIAATFLGVLCLGAAGAPAQEATITPYEDCMAIIQAECNGDAQCVTYRQPDCEGYRDGERGPGGSGNPPQQFFPGGNPMDSSCSARSRIC